MGLRCPVMVRWSKEPRHLPPRSCIYAGSLPNGSSDHHQSETDCVCKGMLFYTMCDTRWGNELFACVRMPWPLHQKRSCVSLLELNMLQPTGELSESVFCWLSTSRSHKLALFNGSLTHLLTMRGEATSRNGVKAPIHFLQPNWLCMTPRVASPVVAHAVKAPEHRE